MILLTIVEKLPYFSIFMNFVTIYFQLCHFTIWPQRNAPLHNSFWKIFQFADIIDKSNFFPWKFPANFFLPPKKIIENKWNHICCKTSLAETNHAATNLLKFDIVCSFWFVKCFKLSIYQCILLFQGTPFNFQISFVTKYIKNRNYCLRKMLHNLWKNYRDTDQQILCTIDFLITITIIITITITLLSPLFCHITFYILRNIM